jgi:hypothetical protein
MAFHSHTRNLHTETLVMNLTIITYKNNQNTSGVALLLGVQPPNSIYMD